MNSRDRSPRSGSENNTESFLVSMITVEKRLKIGVKVDSLEERTYDNNSKRMLSGNVRDKSGKIKIVVFNNDYEAVKNVLKEGSTYYITGYGVKQADARFKKTGDHDFEIIIGKLSYIKAVDLFIPDEPEKPVTPLNKIDAVEKNSLIDIQALCIESGLLIEGESQLTGKPYQKKSLIIIDETETKVELTLWGNIAKETNPVVGDVVKVINAQIYDFGGFRKLQSTFGSVVLMNGLGETSEKLKAWFSLNF